MSLVGGLGRDLRSWRRMAEADIREVEGAVAAKGSSASDAIEVI